MSPKRVSVGEEGEGHIFHVEGPKIRKAQEPTAESLVGGIRRLRVLEAERRIRI